MTYDQDPTRWTTSPEEAPELLRGAFTAARNEGPNPAQMRSLAFKIAAVSAGSAVAVGAAKATAAGNAAATAATWSVGKLAGVLAIAGSIVAGAAIWQQANQAKETPAKTAPTATLRAATPVGDAPQPELVAPPSEKIAAPSAAPAAAAPATTTPAVVPQTVPAEASAASAARRTLNSRSGESVRAAQPSVNERVAMASPQPVSARAPEGALRPSARASAQRTGDSSRDKPSSSAPRTISEVDLLRSAQQALRARPREAFQLTEQHRQLYPTGEFAQERDALAIQALLRAGETEMARDLAVSFIRAHPSSPHAHRFREAMGIR